MSLNPIIVCDACKKDIMTDDPPHYTREEFTRVYQVGDKEITVRLDRRDLCENCYRRFQQMISQDHSLDFRWLLDDFEVARR